VLMFSYYKGDLRMDGEYVGGLSGSFLYDLSEDLSDVKTIMNVIVTDKHGAAVFLSKWSSMWNLGEAETNGAAKFTHDFLFKESKMEITQWDALVAMEYAKQDMRLEVSNRDRFDSELFYAMISAGYDGMTPSDGSL
jgi:hypothetical protein